MLAGRLMVTPLWYRVESGSVAVKVAVFTHGNGRGDKNIWSSTRCRTKGWSFCVECALNLVLFDRNIAQ